MTTVRRSDAGGETLKTAFSKCKPRELCKATLTAAVLLGLAGCSGLTPTMKTPVALAGVKLHGVVHGGQQPISGSAIHLYAASTSGYGAAVSDLLTLTVITDASGSFNFPSSAYSCTAGQLLWIVAVGGSPGGVAGANSNAANMAALGDCAAVNDNTYVSLNEITTVGSVFALAPFMSGYAAVGTSATNTSGLARAFASVNKLVNIATGSAMGAALPTGATGPTAEINTLADALSYCINSTDGSGHGGSACSTLFGLATPSGGTVPANTIDAALAIAHNPTLNTASIYSTVHQGAPFSPRLTSVPTDWTMAVTYAPTGLNAPKSTTVDGSGNIWVANSVSNTVTVLMQTGFPLITLSGNGLNAPSAVAIDSNGYGWITNSGGSSVSAFSLSGASLSGSPLVGAGLSNPTSIAFDATGNAWVANSGNNSVSELSSTGRLVQQVPTGVTAPSAVAINPK